MARGESRMLSLALLGQLRPDAVPVVRAQVAPRDRSASRALDVRTPLNRNWPAPTKHLPQK